MTDVVTFGPEKPSRRPPPRPIIAGLIAIVLVAMAFVLINDGSGPEPVPTVITPSVPVCSGEATPVAKPAALIIDCAAYAGSYLERHQPDAVIDEVRYGTTDLGEQAALSGGLTFTGVINGGDYWARLRDSNPVPAGTVDGSPAMITMMFGGNGAIAWQPVPGVVAYVGYSGAILDDEAVAALQRLAARTRPITDAQWRASDPPTVGPD